MIIAVATQSKQTDSEVFTQGGRAPYFLLFADDGSLIEAIKNPFAVGGGGAGFGVAKMLADRNVDIVVAGKMGENMIGALEARGMKGVEFSGTVTDALSTTTG